MLFVTKGISLWRVYFSTYFTAILPLSNVVRYSGDFVIAGFVIAGLVSTYFTVILSLSNVVRYNGIGVFRVIAGCHCILFCGVY